MNLSARAASGSAKASPEAIIPVSKKTWRWLRQGRPVGLGLRHRVAYAWNALWFDINWRLQQGAMGEDQGPRLAHDPVFILGLWRSGTSYAHELLAACPGIVAPSTRQCMNASTFALARQQGGSAFARRPMDGMEITTNSPQEDEFALLALGVPTVYRAFLDPARIEELERLLSPEYWLQEAPPGWGRAWLNFLCFVQQQATREARAGRLALKSPNHSFRVKAIARMFPQARHLWITRSPEELLQSNRKMWMAMFRRYGLNEVAPERLDHFLVQAFRQAADCLDWMCAHVGRGRLAVIAFDQLQTDPATVLAAAGERLGLAEAARLQEACAAEARRRAGHRPEQYPEEALSADAERALTMLRNAQRRARASHGIAD